MYVWGAGKGTGKVIHLFQTALKNLANRPKYEFSFWSILNTVLCGVVASPTNGLGFQSHWLHSVCMCVFCFVFCVLFLFFCFVLFFLFCFLCVCFFFCFVFLLFFFNLMNIFSRCFSLFLCFIFYFILILFNLLAKAVDVLQYDPIILRKIKKTTYSYGQWRKILPFFLSFFHYV